MKKIMFVLLFLGISSVMLANTNVPPPDGYKSDWKKVDSLIKKGLSKSAKGIVNKIYLKAKAEGNNPQLLKAVIYKLNLIGDLEENEEIGEINLLTNEIKVAGTPVRQILQSILAETYHEYYINNRWRIMERTETMNVEQTDISTWDLKKIQREICKNYLGSLKNINELKLIPLSGYNLILESKTGSKKVRPTLYDFLAHRALDYFKNEESALTEPVNKFTIDQADYFSPSEQFSRTAFVTKDSTSLAFYAINIMKDLIAFHLKDENPAALVDIDLERLTYVKQHAILPVKDSLYFDALSSLEKKYHFAPVSTEIVYLMADFISDNSRLYKPLQSDQHKWDNKIAYDLCNDVIKRFPNASGVNNCRYLMGKISETSINLTTETVNVPDNPFRMLASVKNIKELYIRIIQIQYDTHREIIRKNYDASLIKEYLKLPVYKEWSVNMLDDEDYNTHASEIKIPALPVGYYVILAANTKDFSYSVKAAGEKPKCVAYSNCWISNISYISRDTKKPSYEFHVINRETGQPLANVNVQTYYENYNYKKYIYERIKWNTFTTTNDGYFEVLPPKDNDRSRNFYIDLSNGNDRYVTESPFYLYSSNYRNEPVERIKTFFFSDRAIYRPGQTFFFKGILLKAVGDSNQIIQGEKTTVELFNSNYQKVADMVLTTNEYGTISGSFTIPSDGMNGQMYIKNESGALYFSVEEYKRPKFEVNFKPVSGSYKLNEKIVVKGIAKAYAGNTIADADVKFHVERKARFPYYFWWFIPPSSPATVILDGAGKTNENGEFEITFNAIPDQTVQKNDHPVFDFAVNVNIVDLNGESHSAETVISVGYTALIAEINIPDQLDRESKNEFTIKTNNLNGEPQAVQGEISISRLLQPGKIYRARKWTAPDRFILSKEEFEQNFPNDLYANETDISTWQKQKTILTSPFNTEKSKIFSISDMNSLEPGQYVAELKTKDIYGEPVEWKKYFVVFSPNTKQICTPSPDWFILLKNKVEPGDTASFLIGTKNKDVKVLYEIEFKDKIIQKQWLDLSDEQRKINIPVIEKYRGNFTIHLCFIKNNRIYYHKETIVVPRTNKQLDITFETFRNKLMPGEKEEWRIKIKGMKGEKVASEMLATLYDASLDAFKQNIWSFNIYSSYYSSLGWDVNNPFSTRQSMLVIRNKFLSHMSFRNYDVLNRFHFGDMYLSSGAGYGYADGFGAGEPVLKKNKIMMSVAKSEEKSVMEVERSSNARYRLQGNVNDEALADSVAYVAGESKNKEAELLGVAARKNFTETAFFYPHLQTDKNGDVIIQFTIPEALTKWKMMGFAHTKDLKYGMIQNELVTQKELMVMPNTPRFLRESDTLIFSTKISNVSDKNLSGDVMLNFFDAFSSKPIDSAFMNLKTIQPFKTDAGQSTVTNWKVVVPVGLEAVLCKVVAKSGIYADGEETVLPVLTNRMLVTESMPLPINGKQTKTFTLEKLIHSDSSKTLRHHKVTLEFTPNPAWYAIQALPYMMEYPYECSEQVFSRFYANSIATHIVNSNPKIKTVFDAWKNTSPDALLSNLEKNQELKSLMLEETPWVLNAQNESQRKQRISLLFDLNKMSNETERALKLLQKKQAPNGGWPWFDGMPDSRYITQHILTGMGHLDHLGIKNIKEDRKIFNMIMNAMLYLDRKMTEDYVQIKKYYPAKMNENHLGSEEIQYLYARSFFKNVISLETKNKAAYDYFSGQAKKYWLTQNKYMQGMIALALYRNGDKETSTAIMKSLKEKALHSEEMGMYWKEMDEGYYWWQAPVETQALMIEAFDEVANDHVAVEELKIWLLKQKQTQDWKTTKATADACFALLLKGTDILSKESEVGIILGSKKIDPKKMDDVNVEAGTGYFKTSWKNNEVKPEMGQVTVIKGDEGVAWGALYWQYFEQLDKITPHATPLKLDKKLFVERTTPTGAVIEPVNEKTVIVKGDKIKVRIELRVDRDMEYVHMKDMRAAGLEPVNVFSEYKYQDGLGYYESTKDAATNFFFSYLSKGTYVFEYPLVINQSGDFSNGITTIQCMYAPEFSSHSEGVRVKVK